MAPRGVLVELGGSIGPPVVDPAGILWASVGQSGYVTGIFRDRRSRPFRVSGEGRPLQLILMSGRVVAFALEDWTIYQLDQSGVTSKTVIPSADRDNFATGVSLPAWTDGPLLPMLGERRLIVSDVDQGWTFSQEHGLTDDLPKPNSIGRSVVLVYEVQGYSQNINFTDPKNPEMVEGGRKLAGTSGHRTMLVRNGGLFVDEVHNPKPR
jgi:hypothetical protein